jgi:hypothetical protein
MRKKAPDTILSMSVDRSLGPLSSFSSLIGIEAVIKAKHLLMNMLHQFTRFISPACDQYVQYLLVGPTHRLINMGRGYHLGDLGLPHHTPRPSQLMILCFPLRAPPGLRLTIQPLSPELKREQTLNLMSGTLHSTSTISYPQSIAVTNGKPPNDRINKDK